MTATNIVGTSAVSGTSNAVIPATVPDSPTNLAAIIDSNMVTLSWIVPVFQGGFTVTDYLVEYKLTSSSSWSSVVSVSPFIAITNILNNNSYDFRVSARNVVGQGIASSQISATPGSPAQVLVQNFSDLTAPNISTATRITNEGTTAYEYQYTWCITDSEINVCGGGNDIFNSTAAKLIQPGENFDTVLNSTIVTAGNYWFHLDVQFGSDSSQAIQSFTATE